MDEDQRHAPKAREMRRDAAGFVAHATASGATHRLPLPFDYSVASLRLVDFLLDGLRKGSRERARVAGTLFGLGAYVGEVLVRRTGAEWVDLDESQRVYFGHPWAYGCPTGGCGAR